MAEDPKEPLPTMQLPRGARIESAAPPLEATIVPATGEPAPASAPPPMPEAWRYSEQAEIARGGMGRVVEATDTVLGRTVAVKEALSLDPDSVRRFQRETRITARLEHPSIIPVHDAGTSPTGAPFYVMRKVSGRPLEELVGKHEALEDRLALLPHIVAAANAIAHAHERGIVHRDIKPSNILVGDLGETIVIDWGLAKAIGEADEIAPRARALTGDDDGVKTRAGIVFGTPGFMAPEQLRGAPVDERCDVYALGATLYHLLARRPPHYAKQGDEIMRAALAGPPEPLRAIVPGVPPELATIVDKALAPNARRRYQDARELAADLQRFLAGQLVASHHYSRRERLVRFVRKNRVPVGVTAAALLVLAIGGSLAVARIVDARDRAEAARRLAEQQREKATESLQALTLTTARTRAEDDPTRAVAMLGALDMPRWWRHARAVGAAASLHGIAYGLPASPHTRSLELGRDGTRALTAGDDGHVRVFDLAARTERDVADVHAPAMARFADDERTIVVWRDRAITLLDAATGAARDVTAPTAIASLETAGPEAFWIDDHHALWRLDVTRAGAAPEAVDAGGEAVEELAPSPDGHWLALACADHLYGLDRTQPTLPPQELAVGHARALSWSADAAHLVAFVDQDVVAFEMPAGTIVHRQYAGDRYAVAYSDDQIFTTAKAGVSIVQRDDPRARHIEGDYDLGLHVARGGTLVTGGKQGLIAVISPDDDQVVRTPGLRIEHLGASPRSRWVVASTDDRLLVWDLDALEPRHLGQPGVAGAGFVTADAVVVTYADQPAQWIDLRGSAPPAALGLLPDGIRVLAPSPDGTRAVLVDGARHAHLVVPGAPALDLGGAVEAAAFADASHVAIVTASSVRVEDLAHDRRTVLPEHAGGPLALAARGGWVAAAFADQLVRLDVATGQIATLALPKPPAAAIAVDGDGVVAYALGGELHAWRADGSTPKLVALDQPVKALAIVEHASILAITADGVGRVVPLAGGLPGAAIPNLSIRAAIAPAGLVASTTPDGVLDAIDAPAGERWTLAEPKGRTFTAPQIAPDGRRVLAATPAGVLVWTLDLPDGPEATARWLAALTNASVASGGDGALSWR